jgi:DNA-binding transcriptional regulator GbsR (MarR family)
MVTSAQKRVDERLQRQIVRVCDTIGAFIEYWGFKAVHGRVWTLLALHDGPMAQTEIASTLGVSKSLVSGAVSELTEHGLVRQTHDHRNAPYEAVVDVWPVISEVLRSREWMLVEAARVALEAAIEEAELAQELSHNVRWNAERLQTLMAMTELAQALLRILMGLRMPKAQDRLSGWLDRAGSLADRLRRMI